MTNMTENSSEYSQSDHIETDVNSRDVSPTTEDAGTVMKSAEISMEKMPGVISSDAKVPSEKNASQNACNNCNKVVNGELEPYKVHDYWLKLCMFLRKVYRSILDDEKASADYEEDHMNLVKELFDIDPQQLYHRLEAELQEYVIELKLRQLELLHCLNTLEGPKMFIFCLIEGYQKLLFAAFKLSPLLRQLEIEHLSKFNLTWRAINEHLYHKFVYGEPTINEHLSSCVSRLGTGSSDAPEFNKKIVRQFLKFTDDMTAIGNKAREVGDALLKYHKENMNAKQRMMEVNWELMKTQRKVLWNEIKSSGMSSVLESDMIGCIGGNNTGDGFVECLCGSTKNCNIIDAADQSIRTIAEKVVELKIDDYLPGGKFKLDDLIAFGEGEQRGPLICECCRLITSEVPVDPATSFKITNSIPLHEKVDPDSEKMRKMLNTNRDRNCSTYRLKEPKLADLGCENLVVSSEFDFSNMAQMVAPEPLNNSVAAAVSQVPQQQKVLCPNGQVNYIKGVQQQIALTPQQQQMQLQQQKQQLLNHRASPQPVKQQPKTITQQPRPQSCRQNMQQPVRACKPSQGQPTTQPQKPQVVQQTSQTQLKQPVSQPRNQQQQSGQWNCASVPTCSHAKKNVVAKKPVAVPKTTSQTPVAGCTSGVKNNCSIGTHKHSTTQTNLPAAGHSHNHQSVPDAAKTTNGHTVCPKHGDSGKRLLPCHEHEHTGCINSEHSTTGDESGSDQSSPQRHCDCCYCEVFGHGGPQAAPVSRNYQEMRDRLRTILVKKKEQKTGSTHNEDHAIKNENSTPSESGESDQTIKKGASMKKKPDDSEFKDGKSLYEIINYIEGKKDRNQKRAAKQARRKQRQIEEEERKRKEAEEAERLRLEEMKRKEEEEKRRAEEEKRRQEFLLREQNRKNKKKNNGKQSKIQLCSTQSNQPGGNKKKNNLGQPTAQKTRKGQQNNQSQQIISESQSKKKGAKLSEEQVKPNQAVSQKKTKPESWQTPPKQNQKPQVQLLVQQTNQKKKTVAKQSQNQGQPTQQVQTQSQPKMQVLKMQQQPSKSKQPQQQTFKSQPQKQVQQKKQNIAASQHNQYNQNNGISVNGDESSALKMVTIKRVMQPHTTEPTVTITLRGNSPNEDTVLCTLKNGQMCNAKGKTISKKKIESGQPSNQITGKPLLNIKAPKMPSQKIIKNPINEAGMNNIANRIGNLSLGPDVTAERIKKQVPSIPVQNELTTPTAIQINQAINQLSSYAHNNNININDIRLPPGITITKVDPDKAQPRKPIQMKQQPPPQTQMRQTIFTPASSQSNVIVVDTSDKSNYFSREDQVDNGGKKKRRRRKKEQGEIFESNGHSMPMSIGGIGTMSGMSNGFSSRIIGPPSGMPSNPILSAATDFRNASQPPAIIQMNGNMVTIRNPMVHPSFSQPYEQQDFRPTSVTRDGQENFSLRTDEDDNDVYDDDYDREIEAFKVFCSQSVPAESKTKVNINIEDIVLKKKGPVIGCS